MIGAGHEVIFIEKNKIGFPRISTLQKKNGLTLVSPFFPIDYRLRFRIPIINECYQLWLFRRLKNTFGDVVVINFDYTAHRLSSIFKNSIYYCNDEYIGNSKYPIWIINVYHRKIEGIVAKNSCFCIGTANYLVEKLNKFNSSVYKIPLGGPNPKKINTIHHPRKTEKIKVGLMGSIKLNYISVKIINKILEQEDIKLVFIGTIDPLLKNQIKQFDKISSLGILTGSSLYKEMASFDVAIAPYDVKNINAGGTPNKLLQYLACGCPVVISDIPNINRTSFPSGSVYIANDEMQFISKIRLAHKEDSPQHVKIRRQYAIENTWEQRIQLFLEKIKAHGLNRK